MPFGLAPIEDPFETGVTYGSGGTGYSPGYAVDLLGHARAGLFNTEIFFDSNDYAGPNREFDSEGSPAAALPSGAGAAVATTQQQQTPAANSNVLWWVLIGLAGILLVSK